MKHLVGMLQQYRPATPSTDRAGCCPPGLERRPKPRASTQRRSGLSTGCAETGGTFSLRRTVLGARQLGSDVIAIYGKALRRFLEVAPKRLPLHAAVAFAPRVRLTFGRFGVYDLFNKSTAMPELLDFGRHADGFTKLP